MEFKEGEYVTIKDAKTYCHDNNTSMAHINMELFNELSGEKLKIIYKSSDNRMVRLEVLKDYNSYHKNQIIRVGIKTCKKIFELPEELFTL